MRKKHPRYYCINCLRKFHWKQLPTDESCPYCKTPLRGNTPRIVAQIVTRLLHNRGLKKPKKRDDYAEYLQSPLWKLIRERVLIRDDWECQMCGKQADVVHHKSYKPEVLAGKKDSELVSLCFGCHNDIEFTMVDGKPVKNGLRKANQKLELAMRRTA